MKRLRSWLADWLLARALFRRASRRPIHLCQRLADDTLWAASHPQNFGLCMAELFVRKADRRGGDFHFIRVREWRGLLIAAPRVFWRPSSGEFRVFLDKPTGFILPRWSEEIESAKIRARHP